MMPSHSIVHALQQIKGRMGYLVNQKTEPWFGVHLSLQWSFPYMVVSKLSRPRFLTVRMDMINKCNLHCKMCYFSLNEVKRKPRIEMSLQLFRKIAKDVFPVASQLIISAGAEPLCSEQFPDMLAIAAQYNIPHVAFFTNGTLFNHDNISKIIDTRVNVIIISFDGATPRTYEAIRRGAKFDQVVENIRLLQEIKAKKGLSTPAIHFGVVLMNTNIKELPDLLVFAKELGIAHVTASHIVPYYELGTREESLSLHQERTNIYLNKARQTAQEIGLSFDAPPNFSGDQNNSSTPPTDSLCQWPWREILIRPDGNVHPCCYWYEDRSMGNFNSQRFKKIWYGREYTKLRQELTTHSLREMCRKCPEMNNRMYTEDFSEVKIVG